MLARQEADGCWGGIQPPWVYSLLALHLEGYANDHPVMAAGIRGLDGFMVEKDEMRWLEACQSPVWDTALAVVALTDTGLAPDHPALVRAGQWILQEEITTTGDWAVRRPNLRPGGWAFEFANDTYPDIDDTAVVAMSLRRLVGPDGGITAAESAPSAGRPAMTSSACGRRSAEAWSGWWACAAATVAGGPSTPTTRGSCARPCPSATSARSSTPPAPT